MSSSLRRISLVAQRGVQVRLYSNLKATSASTSVRSFHNRQSFYMPIPASTDNAKSMDSTNTSGKGPNEPRSTPNPKTKQPITPDSPAGTSTHTKNVTDVSDAEPKSTNKTAKATAGVKSGTRGFSTRTTTAKHAKNETKAVVEDTHEQARHAAKKTANAASSTYQDTKEDVKHGLNTAANKVKQTARKVSTEMGAPEDDYADAPASTPSSSSASSATPRTTYGSSSSASTSSSSSSNMNTQDMKQRASAAASNLKESMTPSDETKAKMSSAAASVKEGASRIVDTLKAAPQKISEMTSNASEKLSNMGDRAEEKFEKFGDNLIKSGENIDKRDRQAGEPTPDPMNRVGRTGTTVGTRGVKKDDDPFSKSNPEYDAVDHLPNPENKNDVLPGTGAKDRRKNTPLSDASERGQFPG